MWPLARGKAVDFWRGVMQGVAQGERILLIATAAAGQMNGTVQPENQPHRADVAKMLVHSSARRQGRGEASIGAAENAATRSSTEALA